MGQFWSTEKTQGAEGHLIEILGLTTLGMINGRRWTPLIPRDTCFPHNVNLHTPSSRDRLWIHPAYPGTSRGSGATDFFPLDILAGARLQHVTVGPETPSSVLDENDFPQDDIARQVLFCSLERPPVLTPPRPTDATPSDQVLLTFLGDCSHRQVEVFVDGSLHFPATALDHAFPQPKSHRRASYAQGDILIHPDPSSPISSRLGDFSISTIQGASLQLSDSSSIELYSIITALYCM